MDEIQKTNKFNIGMKIVYLGHICYFLFGLAYILGPSLNISWFGYFKAVPLLIMILLVFKERKNGSVVIMMLGLLFGIGGDILLQQDGDNYFLMGAGVFLINHVIYNIYFLSLWDKCDGLIFLRRKIPAFICCVLLIAISSINLATSFADRSKEKDGLLAYMLPIYMVLLDFTAINPILLLVSQQRVQKDSILLALGGICYYISDNVLGKSKFTDFQLFGLRKANGILIMVTYYLAQYLIPLAFIQKMKSNQRDSLEKSLLSENTSI